MATANKNHKTWFNYPRTLPKDALKALYKKTLYHKTLPEGGIDHSVPPSFKLKIPYYNDKFNFTLLDENNKPMDFDLDYLQEKIVDKCYIKCIFNPVIWLRKDKNFGITYNVVALQIIENSNKDNYKKIRKNQKKTVLIIQIKLKIILEQQQKKMIQIQIQIQMKKIFQICK